MKNNDNSWNWYKSWKKFSEIQSREELQKKRLKAEYTSTPIDNVFIFTKNVEIEKQEISKGKMLVHVALEPRRP